MKIFIFFLFLNFILNLKIISSNDIKRTNHQIKNCENNYLPFSNGSNYYGCQSILFNIESIGFEINNISESIQKPNFSVETYIHTFSNNTNGYYILLLQEVLMDPGVVLINNSNHIGYIQLKGELENLFYGKGKIIDYNPKANDDQINDWGFIVNIHSDQSKFTTLLKYPEEINSNDNNWKDQLNEKVFKLENYIPKSAFNNLKFKTQTLYKTIDFNDSILHLTFTHILGDISVYSNINYYEKNYYYYEDINILSPKPIFKQ